MDAPPLNPCLREFFHMTDGRFWFKHGVKLISHLFLEDTFRSFEDFCRDFGLPSTAYFQYMQIRHTAAAHQPSPLECLLIDPSHTKLVSTYYKSPLYSSANRTRNTESRWRSTTLPVYSIACIEHPPQFVLEVIHLMAHLYIWCGNVHRSGNFGQKSLPL